MNQPTIKLSRYWLLSLLIVSLPLLASCSSKPLVDTNQAKGNHQTDRGNVFSSLAEETIKASAHISIYTAEIFASDAAEKELNKFRTGEHDGTPAVFSETSIESEELFEGKYYQELNEHLVEEMAKWYQGKIPNSGGLFSQANTFRVFSPNDALWEISDGIDLADIIGTFTYFIRATTNHGIIYFTGVNKLSLESYSGENYLGHGLVNNPELGPLSSIAQVFKWRVVIPEKYSQ